jgi:hypothetical protein
MYASAWGYSPITREEEATERSPARGVDAEIVFQARRSGPQTTN